MQLYLNFQSSFSYNQRIKKFYKTTPFIAILGSSIKFKTHKILFLLLTNLHYRTSPSYLSINIFHLYEHSNCRRNIKNRNRHVVSSRVLGHLFLKYLLHFKTRHSRDSQPYYKWNKATDTGHVKVELVGSVINFQGVFKKFIVLKNLPVSVRNLIWQFFCLMTCTSR